MDGLAIGRQGQKGEWQVVAGGWGSIDGSLAAGGSAGWWRGKIGELCEPVTVVLLRLFSLLEGVRLLDPCDPMSTSMLLPKAVIAEDAVIAMGFTRNIIPV